MKIIDRKLRMLSILLITLVMSSCGNYKELKSEPSASFSNINFVSGLTFDDVKDDVFAARCVSCHPAYSDFDSVVGDLDAITASIASGRMPADGPLASDLKDKVLSWIQVGAPEGSSTAGTAPVEDLNILAPNWKSISKNIFQKKCVACHNPKGRYAQLPLDRRSGLFTKVPSSLTGLLFDFSDPAQSYMIEVIADPFEPMPPEWSSFDKVTAEELTVLQEWIALGLP